MTKTKGLEKSPRFAKKFPNMDVSAVNIDGRVGCSDTKGPCIAANGEVQLLFNDVPQVVGIRSSITRGCDLCLK